MQSVTKYINTRLLIVVMSSSCWRLPIIPLWGTSRVTWRLVWRRILALWISLSLGWILVRVLPLRVTPLRVLMWTRKAWPLWSWLLSFYFNRISYRSKANFFYYLPVWTSWSWLLLLVVKVVHMLLVGSGWLRAMSRLRRTTTWPWRLYHLKCRFL